MPGPSLPGAVAHTAVDTRLLDQTVRKLNRHYVRRGLQTAEELVQIVTEAFWNGDLDLALTGMDRHASFRALRKRSDLQLSYAGLVRMMRVVHLLRILRKLGPITLSYSHLIELLSCDHAPDRWALAQQAMEREWSVRDLRAAVLAANGEVQVPAGPLRRVHAGLKRTTRVLSGALAEAPAMLDSPEERAVLPEVLAELDALEVVLSELRTTLEGGGS